MLQDNFWESDSNKKVNFLSIKKESFFNVLQIEINLSDLNNNIFKFINEAIALNKFIMIKNFKWSFFAKNINQNIIILLKIYIFYFNNKKLILDLKKINKFITKPFSENRNLTKFSLDKILMLGSLSSDKEQNWGFVRLPNKQICKVKLGDRLGLEQDLIIGIYSKKIIIKNNNNLKK